MSMVIAYGVLFVAWFLIWEPINGRRQARRHARKWHEHRAEQSRLDREHYAKQIRLDREHYAEMRRLDREAALKIRGHR